jgi:peptidoglycan hydrolase CwlO-like protein
MLDHLIDPDIPTKRQELEHDIAECKEFISDTQNKVEHLEDQIDCANNELKELIEKLRTLEPDPDRER